MPLQVETGGFEEKRARLKRLSGQGLGGHRHVSAGMPIAAAASMHWECRRLARVLNFEPPDAGPHVR
jgi:hypothetical protein